MSSTINELQVSYIHLVLQYPRDTAVAQKCILILFTFNSSNIHLKNQLVF